MDATMTLKEFCTKYEEDENIFWRMDSGDHLNLLDEALDQLDKYKEMTRCRHVATCSVFEALGEG